MYCICNMDYSNFKFDIKCWMYLCACTILVLSLPKVQPESISLDPLKNPPLPKVQPESISLDPLNNPLKVMDVLTCSCKFEPFDTSNMVFAWKFNGEIFADIFLSKTSPPTTTTLLFRSNANNIFGFDIDQGNNAYWAPIIFPTVGIDVDRNSYNNIVNIYISDWRFNGDYNCVVCTQTQGHRCDTTNPMFESRVDTLNVYYFPPSPPLMDSPLLSNGNMAVFGHETMVSCYSLPGYPEVDFTLSTGSATVIGNKFKNGDMVYYNYTFTPTLEDDDVVFSCSISNGNVESSTVTLPAITVVSVPEVTIDGDLQAGIGLPLELTCGFTSATTTPVSNYQWTVSDISSDRFTIEDDNRLTIHLIQESDNGVVVTCEVTDTMSQTGIGEYVINAVDQDDLTSKIPGTSPPNSNDSKALIIAMSIVGAILLLLILAAVVWYCKKKRDEKVSWDKMTTKNTSTNKNGYNSNSSKPYTISGQDMSSKPDVVPGEQYYDDRKYPDDSYRRDSITVADGSGGRYSPEHEKQNAFHVSADYHYNPGYDNEKPPYGNPEFEDVQVGDFTNPIDRQPAYGQGYNDGGYDDGGYNDGGYNDGGYDDGGYDLTDSKPPIDHFDDPIDLEPTDGYYDDRDNRADIGGYNDDGYLPGDGYLDEPPHSPHGDSYNGDYYPPEEQYPSDSQYPPQDSYADPPLADDNFYVPQDDNVYPKDEQDTHYDHEPYGERDQVPDGQEADYPGEPYREDSYHEDRMPDGGSFSEDPYFQDSMYGVADTQVDEFGGLSKLHSDSLTSDRFDPSYV